ncbi:MAG: hypothetical protein HUU20_17085 [Pirellulales bacterium]|nr:hypothetical protein [Pirellulales bacterium]
MAGGKEKVDARAAGLGEAMLEKLRSLRETGDVKYPLTLVELASLAAPGARAPQVLAAVRKKAFSSRAIVAKAGRIDAPVAAREDLELLAGSALTLEFALRARRTETIHARTVADLGGWLTSAAKFKELFKRTVKEQVEREQTPPTVAWIVDRKPKLFLLEEIRPRLVRERLVPGEAITAAEQPRAPATAAAPVRAEEDFAARFEEAFDQLDRRKGSHNFVSLVDLRRWFAGLPREQFDAGLRQLRIDGRFTLSAAESVYGIRPEQREAGLEEGGALLLHVSRKTP